MFEKDLYRTLAKNLPGFGILLFDHSLRYIMALGDDVLRSYGLSESDVVGKLLEEISFPSYYNTLSDHYRMALEGITSNIEIKHGEKSYAIHIAPVRSVTGQISSGIVTFHDITEMVQTREALRSM